MTQQIIAISRPSYNVLTETDPNHFIFHSSYNTFKILLTGTVSIASSSHATVTSNVNHNLGKRTGFLLVWQVDGDAVQFHDNYVGNYGTDGSQVTTSDLDTLTGVNGTNTLTISYFSYSGIRTAVVRYYIFEVKTS